MLVTFMLRKTNAVAVPHGLLYDDAAILASRTRKQNDTLVS